MRVASIARDVLAVRPYAAVTAGPIIPPELCANLFLKRFTHAFGRLWLTHVKLRSAEDVM